MPATKSQAEARTPAKRCCRILSRPDGIEPGVVEIDVPTSTYKVRTTRYLFSVVPCDPEIGDKAVEFVKDDGTSYHVVLINRLWTCECLGFLGHGHCVHSGATPKLLANI